MAHIAIIGGGAAGAAVFGALLHKHDNGCVHWITGAGEAGHGVAYATSDERHLLNVRAAGMGLYVDQAEDFLTHAQRDAAVEGSEFLPRRLFGEFVQAQVRARMHTAEQRGRRFALHAQEASAVLPTLRGYRVMLANGETLQVDAVVLAVGALSPRALRTVSDSALHSGAYELDPWRLPQRTKAPRRLVVIGTGLTAVDTLLSAATRWPDAELVAVSRHGQLPFVHPLKPSAPYAEQPALNQALLTCEGPLAVLRTLRPALREAQQTDWRAIIDGLRPVNSLLWQRFTLAQRRQFMRHARWLWEAARHRTAPRSAEAIQQLLDEGRLSVQAARVLGVDGDGPLQVHLRSRATQSCSTLEADLVVQATGLDTAVAFSPHSLLSQLIEAGLAVPDPLQLGVAATPAGALLTAQGKPQAGLYAIGSLLRGNLWECTAMPEIRLAAHALADRLLPAVASSENAGEALLSGV